MEVTYTIQNQELFSFAGIGTKHASCFMHLNTSSEFKIQPTWQPDYFRPIEYWIRLVFRSSLKVTSQNMKFQTIWHPTFFDHLNTKLVR